MLIKQQKQKQTNTHTQTNKQTLTNKQGDEVETEQL